jgi:membrane-associated phospholipid phosphatase
MRQLFGVRSGALTVIRLEDAVGLISWPSFHVAGALIVTWALRRTWCRWPLVLLNAALSLSTVLLGLHYAIDVVSAFVVCACSIALEKLLRPWIEELSSSAPDVPHPAFLRRTG